MSIPSWAKAGAKVVCVDDEWDDEYYSFPLIKGSIYTIATLMMHESGRGKYAGIHSPTITLIEADNPDSPTNGFKLARFRPAVTLRQDVRMVKALVREMGPTERLDRLAELLDLPEH